MNKLFKWLFLGFVGIYIILTFVVSCGNMAGNGFLGVTGNLIIGIFMLAFLAALAFAVITNRDEFLRFLLPAAFVYVLVTNALNLGTYGSAASSAVANEQPVLGTAFVFLFLAVLPLLAFVVFVILERLFGIRLPEVVNLIFLIAYVCLAFLGTFILLIGYGQNQGDWVIVTGAVADLILLPGLVFGYLYYTKELAY